MSTEENKAVYWRIYDEAFNKKNIAIIDELVDPSFVYHDPHNPQEGPEQQKEMVTTYLNAIPDMRFMVEDWVAEGDKVAMRWKAIGTHKGEFMGIAPTGKKVTATGISIARFTDGKMVEEWESLDMLGLMQQIGAIPTSE